MSGWTIREFATADADAVVRLWTECGLLRPWNDPVRDIERKLADSPWGFLVAEDSSRIIGAMMVGYDGHRGSINYLAVSPESRSTGLGRCLVENAEELLVARGCPKVNLSVRADNAEAIGFYEHAATWSRAPIAPFHSVTASFSIIDTRF